MRISHLKTKIIASAVYLAIVALLYLFGISCIFQSTLGIYCPGCGMTRALISALQLDFKAAFSYHPMFWSLPVLYLYFLLDDGIFHSKLWDRVVLCAIGVGFLISWILKLC